MGIGAGCSDPALEPGEVVCVVMLYPLELKVGLLYRVWREVCSLVSMSYS